MLGVNIFKQIGKAARVGDSAELELNARAELDKRILLALAEVNRYGQRLILAEAEVLIGEGRVCDRHLATLEVAHENQTEDIIEDVLRDIQMYGVDIEDIAVHTYGNIIDDSHNQAHSIADFVGVVLRRDHTRVLLDYSSVCRELIVLLLGVGVAVYCFDNGIEQLIHQAVEKLIDVDILNLELGILIAEHAACVDINRLVPAGVIDAEARSALGASQLKRDTRLGSVLGIYFRADFDCNRVFGLVKIEVHSEKRQERLIHILAEVGF